MFLPWCICCVKNRLEILCKIPCHTYACSQPPKGRTHCQTGFFEEKKKLWIKFPKHFLWHTVNNAHQMNRFSDMQCLWRVSPSRLLTTLFGQLVRQEELWVVRAGMMPACLKCDYVSVTPPPLPCTHTTQCAIMLLALCGDPQYTCGTGPVWDCLFFFHIKRPLKEAPAAKSTSSLCDHQCFNQSGGLGNPRPLSAFCSFNIL